MHLHMSMDVYVRVMYLCMHMRMQMYLYLHLCKCRHPDAHTNARARARTHTHRVTHTPHAFTHSIASRTRHRGLANRSETPRVLMYIAFESEEGQDPKAFIRGVQDQGSRQETPKGIAGTSGGGLV